MSLQKYKSNRNVVYSSKYHVVWCPKYRKSVLIDEIAERLETILRETSDELQAESEWISGRRHYAHGELPLKVSGLRAAWNGYRPATDHVI